MTQAVKERTTTAAAKAPAVDTKLEIVVIPVSDVDRAKAFYANLGWRLDADLHGVADWRGVQMTPPGSPCSIHFGKGITSAAPGSAQNLYLIVSDIAAARADLAARGAELFQKSKAIAAAGRCDHPHSGVDRHLERGLAEG